MSGGTRVVRARAAFSFGERRREMVGRPAGALEHLALIVRAVLDLVFGGDRRRLRLGEAGPAGSARLRNASSSSQWQIGADLAVDLEAALQLRLVEFAERAGERPFLPRRRRRARAPARTPAAPARPASRRATRAKMVRCIVHASPVAHAFGAQNRFRNRIRQRLGLLEHAEQRQDDQEVREVVERQDARGDHVAAFRRAWSRASRARCRRSRRARRTAGNSGR